MRSIPHKRNLWHQNQILIFAKKLVPTRILTQIFKFKFSTQGPTYKGHNPWHTLYVTFFDQTGILWNEQTSGIFI